MEATRGDRWSLRAPLLIAAFAGLALSASGCFVESSSSPPPDADRDGIADIYDDCPTLAEDYNGIADDDGCPDAVCLPDLLVNWAIFRASSTSTPLTCAQAGGADTLTALIDGGAFGTTLNAFDSACPANMSSGSFVVELPATGTYNVSLELSALGNVLSETNVLVQPVGCDGASTPVAPMYVNF